MKNLRFLAFLGMMSLAASLTAQPQWEVVSTTFAKGTVQSFIDESGIGFRGTITQVKDFDIPELERKRTIWIFTPHEYESSTDRYPVLYMQDGRNLFSQRWGASAEWGVDDTLNGLKALGTMKGMIVVGIDNGGPLRPQEYVPSLASGNRADSVLYAQFLATTLKSYVDTHYRTLPDKQNTWIAGSSFGAVISLETARLHPQVFGKVMAFSPSLWPGDFALLEVYKQEGDFTGQSFYLDMGTKEGGNEEYWGPAEKMEEFAGLLKARNAEKVYLVVDRKAQHSEHYWRKRFPLALAKLGQFNLPILSKDPPVE